MGDEGSGVGGGGGSRDGKRLYCAVGSIIILQCLGFKSALRALELCESRGGRPGLPSLINLQFLWT